MNPVEMSMGHKQYSIRLMIQDAFIVLAPSLLILIGVLWAYRKEWSVEELAKLLAPFLPY